MPSETNKQIANVVCVMGMACWALILSVEERLLKDLKKK